MKIPGKISYRQKTRTVLAAVAIILFSVTIFYQTGDIGDVVASQFEAGLIDEGSLSTTDQIISRITSDADDDYWNLKNSVWTHGTTSNEVLCRQYPGLDEDIAQFRFLLQVPQHATIHHATISVYETNDNIYVGAWARRIDETNVGSLEADSAVPKVTTANQALHVFNGRRNEWTTTDITGIVQDQVNLPGWQGGYYIGLQFNLTGGHGTGGWNSFEDFQSSSSNHAFISVTYTDSVDWLSGWGYRRFYVMGPAEGAGTDYTLPVYVSTGTGSNHDNWVYLGDKVKNDFEDIRFTASDGTTLLPYQLSETHNDVSTDHVTDAVVDLYGYPHNYPAAYYYNGRTYVVFQGDLDSAGHDLDPHIMYYDHSSDSWSGIYYIGYNPAPLKESQDDHGSPCMWIDSQGYIHVIYGAHDYNLKHAISDNPEDITSWTLQDDFHVSRDDRPTYPHIGYDPDNDHVYMTYRSSTLVPDADPQVFIKSTDGGKTWSDEQVILTSPAHMWCAYPGASTFDAQTNLFHIGYKFWNYTAGKFQGIYYLALNVETGHIFNAAGSDLGTSTTLWDPNLRVYDNGPSYPSMYGPDTHIDENGNPYMIFSESGSPRKTYFTYWAGSAWSDPEVVSNPGWTGAGHDFIVHNSTSITAFLNDGQDIARYTWDGNTWTYREEIYDGDELLSHTLVPINHDDEFQVVFSEYEWGVAEHKTAYAWGSNGLLRGKISKHAKFHVKIPFGLDDTEQAIYVYYGNSGASSTSESFAVSEDPWVPHGPWGAEEGLAVNGPSIDQAPTVANMDTGGYLYAEMRKYEVTLLASDVNGSSNINYMDLTLTSNSRTVDYWTVRFHEGTNLFSEQNDPQDYITLDAGSSTYAIMGNSIQATFHLTINWNHPDVRSVDARCGATDDQLHSHLSYFELDWNVETRLELDGGLALSDAAGTPNRGDIGSDILASGSVSYLGSSVSPPAPEIEVYVVSTDVSTGPWRGADYDETSGDFSVTVDTDDEVGIDVYRFKVVQEGEGADAPDLLDQTYTRTYIADCIVGKLSEDEAASNETVVYFLISLTCAYDGAVINGYTVVIDKNGEDWLTTSEGGFTDVRGPAVENTYTIVSASEATHGLTTLQLPWSPFVPGGDGPGSGPGTITSPEEVMNSLYQGSLIVLENLLALGSHLYIFEDAFVYLATVPASLVIHGGPQVILLALTMISASILIAYRSQKQERAVAVRKMESMFRSRGGLVVYTIMPMREEKADLQITVGGFKISCLVLETDHEMTHERFLSIMKLGERHKGLLKLFSAPIGDAELDLLGLIWDPD